MRLQIIRKDEVTPWINSALRRTGGGHMRWAIKNIAGRVIHAAITRNFYVEATRRPKRWPPLGKYYAKQKTKDAPFIKKAPMRQPADLGIYPTPYGNINIRTGALFNSLGTILRITAHGISYGVDSKLVKHAKDVAEGKTIVAGTPYTVQYDRKLKNGNFTTVTSRRKVRKSIQVPARPFDFMYKSEHQIIADGIKDYVMVAPGRKIVMLGDLGYRILAAGGRRVYIMRQGK